MIDGWESIRRLVAQLALTLEDRGSFNEAEKLQRQPMQSFLEIFGEEHPMVAMAWVNLANLRQTGGDRKEAERYQRKALELEARWVRMTLPQILSGGVQPFAPLTTHNLR